MKLLTLSPQEKDPFKIVAVLRQLIEVTHGRQELLTADRTYWIRTDGSDNNTGLANSASGAFKTLQYAWDLLSSTINVGSYDLTINLIGAGPYTCPSFLAGFQGGRGRVILVGDGTPSVVEDVGFGGVNTCSTCAIKDIKFTAPGSNICFQSYMGGRIDLVGNITLDIDGGIGLFASNNGVLVVSGGAAISVLNGGDHFALVNDRGQLYFESDTTGITVSASTTITMNGTPAFVTSTVGADNGGSVHFSDATFSGAATGVRYTADNLGLVDSKGKGANFIPGDAPGTTSNGGVYA